MPLTLQVVLLSEYCIYRLITCNKFTGHSCQVKVTVGYMAMAKQFEENLFLSSPPLQCIVMLDQSDSLHSLQLSKTEGRQERRKNVRKRSRSSMDEQRRELWSGKQDRPGECPRCFSATESMCSRAWVMNFIFGGYGGITSLSVSFTPSSQWFHLLCSESACSI